MAYILYCNSSRNGEDSIEFDTQYLQQYLNHIEVKSFMVTYVHKDRLTCMICLLAH